LHDTDRPRDRLKIVVIDTGSDDPETLHTVSERADAEASRDYIDARTLLRSLSDLDGCTGIAAMTSTGAEKC
jgi:hypothetical protein